MSERIQRMILNFWQNADRIAFLLNVVRWHWDSSFLLWWGEKTKPLFRRISSTPNQKYRKHGLLKHELTQSFVWLCLGAEQHAMPFDWIWKCRLVVLKPFSRRSHFLEWPSVQYPLEVPSWWQQSPLLTWECSPKLDYCSTVFQYQSESETKKCPFTVLTGPSK